MKSEMPSANMKSLKGKRVLVVDDREENRRLMRAILKIEGALILEAENGHQGVQIAQQELPDLILMDFQMPDLDGVVATRLLRQNPVSALLPVIFLTASVDVNTRREALEAGADGFLTKPLDPPQLIFQISEILGRCIERNSR